MTEALDTKAPSKRSLRTRRVQEPTPATAAPAASKVAAGVEFFGTKTGLAAYLEVAKTQPARWISGAEIPKPATARLIKDLDYVLDRVRTDMDSQASEIWLRSPNAFLNGATPLDWLKLHGPAEVIAAFDAAEAGSYP